MRTVNTLSSDQYSGLTRSTVSTRNRPDGHGSVNTTCAVDDRGERTKLTIVHSINLEPSIIAAEDYDALFSADSDLSHPRTRTIMVTRDGE